MRKEGRKSFFLVPIRSIGWFLMLWVGTPMLVSMIVGTCRDYLPITPNLTILFIEATMKPT